MGNCTARVDQRRRKRTTYEVVRDIAAGEVETPPTPKQQQQQQFSAYGKLILFGEHFVVHNQVPALVVAVKAVTTAVVEISDAEWSSGLLIEDDRPAVSGYKSAKADEMIEATKRVLAHFNVSAGVKIRLAGDLCAVSGVGASAANCVAVARAVSAALELESSEEEINQAGYAGETAYHGTPSGIDNTCSTYGGLLKFRRSLDGAPVFESKSLNSFCRIVYASTGITSSTTEVVGDVKRKKEEDPEWYSSLEARYLKILSRAEVALDQGDWPTVGLLASENHNVLKELSVSCEELDSLVEVALSAGAAGAKLAGTGRGGLMLAICLSEEAQNSVYDALRLITPDVWATEV